MLVLECFQPKREEIFIITSRNTVTPQLSGHPLLRGHYSNPDFRFTYLRYV